MTRQKKILIQIIARGSNMHHEIEQELQQKTKDLNGEKAPEIGLFIATDFVILKN